MKRTRQVFLLLFLISAGAVSYAIWGNAVPFLHPPTAQTGAARAYLYYTVKDTRGFVLARAPKGADGQPLGTPQPLMPLGNGFGLTASDSVSSVQLSPDSNYLAIDGERDHGEQVWMYDTQHMAIATTPDKVLGNFLHWLPNGNGHTFLYRPVFPMGPDAPMDNGTWNPGLWVVDAETGKHQNIDIGVPSSDLVDAVPSPDGSRIVYSTTSGLGQGSDTFLINSDGSGRTHLFSSTGMQSIAGLFAWSPDGARIAYERLSDSPTPFLSAGLWIMNTQGSEQQRLTDVDGGHGFAPVWSPDGEKIAFVARTNSADHQADVQAQALQSAISVIDIHNRQAQLVASAEQTGKQLNINPTWTTNSASITFTALNPANRVLGGTPRYWSARLNAGQGVALVTPISPDIPHIVALG